MLDVISYSKVLSIQNSVTSGWKSVYLDSQTGTVTATDNDGRTYTYQYPLPKDGKDGASVVSARIEEIDEEYHLILVRDDDVEIDAGILPSGGGSEPVLESDFTATVAIGQVKKGTKYPKGTPIEKVVTDMLTDNQPPTLNFTYLPNKTPYDKVAEKLSSLDFTATVTLGTNDIKNIKIYIDNTVVKEWNTGVSKGGRYDFTYEFKPPTNSDNINLRCVVEDVNGLSATKTGLIQFVGKTYYGFVEQNVDSLTEDDIKGLQNSILKTTRTYKYEHITFPYGELKRIVYAIPKTLGKVTRIMDEKNNFNYTDSFQEVELRVDGLDYYAYYSKTPTGADENQLTFS